MFRSVTFDMLADADPGLLSRIVIPFARRDLTPDQVRSRRLGNVMQISVTVDGVPTGEVHLVEGNLRQIVGMRRVEIVVHASMRAVA